MTKSIRLTEAEAAELKAYVDVSGEAEATALKQAALRGLREMRLERAIRAFRAGMSSSEASEVAGLPRAIFLQILIDRGETLDRGPSRLGASLEFLGEALESDKLTAAARKLAERSD